MTITVRSLFCASFVLCLVFPAFSQDAAAATISPSAATITADEIQAHVDYLASDLLEGRNAGHTGEKLAAQYIASCFSALGMRPAAANFAVAFDLPGGGDAGDPAVSFGETTLTGSSLLDVVGGSALGTAGGFLAADESDVDGKIVLIHRFEGDKEAKKKAKEFAANGAVGVCFVTEHDWLPQGGKKGDLRRMGSRGPDDILTKLGAKGGDESIPDGIIYRTADEPEDGKAAMTAKDLPDSVKKKLMEELGLDLEGANIEIMVAGPDDLGELPEGVFDGADGNFEIQFGGLDLFGGGKRLAIPVLRASRLVGDALLAAGERGEEVSFHVPCAGGVESSNVLGVIEGSDPVLKDEYVVIGGHYDHVGADGEGKVWNGADDNASGTAAVIEIAEAVSAMAVKPKRSILLAAWGAEEVGLVGSRAFAQNPPVPREKIAAYINLDMISRNDPGTIGVLAASDDLKEWTNAAAAAHGFDVDEMATFFIMASDSGSLVSLDVPVVGFFSGMHGDYHRDTDDPDTIDAHKAARVARTALDVALKAADSDARPDFVKPKFGGLFGGKSSQSETKRRLGIFPELDPSGEGVVVRKVAADSVAARAGIEVGDRIVRIGSRDITKTSDIGKALAAVTANEPFEIHVIRKPDGVDATVIVHGLFEK